MPRISWLSKQLWRQESAYTKVKEQKTKDKLFSCVRKLITLLRFPQQEVLRSGSQIPEDTNSQGRRNEATSNGRRVHGEPNIRRWLSCLWLYTLWVNPLSPGEGICVPPWTEWHEVWKPVESFGRILCLLHSCGPAAAKSREGLCRTDPKLGLLQSDAEQTVHILELIGPYLVILPL